MSVVDHPSSPTECGSGDGGEAFVSPEEQWFYFPLDVKLREYSLAVTFLGVETLGGASLPFVGKISD